MDFEIYLRSFLDSTNHAGRAIAEHRVMVSEPLPGVLVIRIHPEGFNSEERVFAVQAGVLGPTSDEVLHKMSADAQAAELEAQKARDLAHLAKVEEERAVQAKAEIREREREAKEAAARRPPDPSKLLPDGDQRSPTA